MKTKKKLLINYLFSIGFILLIVIFLSSIVFISRSVLSNTQIPIIDHVKNTQNILDSISEVESITKSSKNLNNSLVKFNKNNFNLNYLNSNYSNLKISNPAFINVNENKSILTFFVDGKISKLNNSYYKQIKNSTKLFVGTTIIYDKNKIGEILETKADKFKVLNEIDSKIYRVNFENILGILIIKK